MAMQTQRKLPFAHAVYQLSTFHFTGLLVSCAPMHVRPLLIFLPLLLTACGSFDFKEWKKKEKFPFTVHSQGSDMDSPRSIFRMPIPGRQQPVVFNLVPEFSSQNIAAVHAFPASNGNGNGVTLKLDFRGAEALHMASRTRRSELLLTMVGGRPVDYVALDKPVDDGIFTIWEGVPDEAIAELQEKFPPINKLKSMSGGQDMLPTTRGEKRRSKQDYDEASKRESKANKDPTTTGPGAVQAPLPLPGAPGGNGLPRADVMPPVPAPLQNRQDQPLPPAQR
jgi:hypothetical protein